MAIAHIAQLAGRHVGQIDQPAAQEGAAVVDAHHHRPAVVEASHAHIAGQRQRGVRGRHAIHVVGFADGGFLAVEALAVPGSHPLLAIGLAFGHRHELLAHHLVGTVGAGTQRFILRDGIGLFHQRGHPLGVGTARAVIQVIAAARLGAAGAAGTESQRQQGDGAERPSGGVHGRCSGVLPCPAASCSPAGRCSVSCRPAWRCPASCCAAPRCAALSCGPASRRRASSACSA